MNVTFGAYRPDLPSITPGYSSNIRNAIPIQGANGIAYAPYEDIAVLAGADTLPSSPRGALSAVTPDGTYKSYVGTASKLYEMSAVGGFTEIGTGYSVPSDDSWSTLYFGKYALFTNKTDGMLQYDTVLGGSVTSVANAPANTRSTFEAFDCVFSLDGDSDNKLMQWSNFNDHTDWTKGVAGQKQFATGQELVAGSAISDNMAVVLQRDAVTRLTRTSDRYLFTSSTMAEGRGAVASQSVVTNNGRMFFLDSDGFYMTDGQGIRPIGAEKINRTFAENCAAGNYATVQGAADPARQLILWRYNSVDNNSTTIFSNILAYSWKLDEFVELDVQTAFLFTMATPGYTLEDLDTFGDLDSLPASLDARIWQGGEPTIGAIDENLQFGFFNGSNLAATLETNCISSARSQLYRSVVPDTDSANATVQIGVEDIQSDNKSYSTAADIQPSGRAPVRARGKVSSLKLNVPAGETWKYANGFSDIEVSSGGAR